MSSAHWHLILVHIPILLIPLALCIFVWGAWMRNESFKTLAMTIFIGAAALSVPTFLTGEPSEEIVEDLPLVSESFIEAHEEAAEFAFYATLVTGGLALAALLLRRNQKFQKASTVALVFAGAVSSVSLGRAGYLGGQIRHSEIRDEQSVEKSPEKYEDDE